MLLQIAGCEAATNSPLTSQLRGDFFCIFGNVIIKVIIYAESGICCAGLAQRSQIMKYTFIAGSLLLAGTIAGCGGGSSSLSTAVTGKVADGYLVGAVVFLDRNDNYKQDAGEPSTTTDANGSYILNINSADVGKYPLVAAAIMGQTIDKDTNSPVVSSYVMSAPAGNARFISPMSTLIREKMAANPGMALSDAMTQLRNQMNLPTGIDIMADYVAGSQSGTNSVQYQSMHTVARQMAALMSGQAGQVMNGSGVNLNRYRTMIGTINSNMSAIVANVNNGLGMDSLFMINMMSNMQTQLAGMSSNGGFASYSGMFRNMTGHSRFWSSNGTPMTPMSGGMMR